MKKLHAIIAITLLCAARGHTAVPSAEKLLPEDTLIMISIPDFAKARAYYASSPQGQFWNDPAMKPFKDKFVEKFKSEFVGHFEHDLGIHLDDYTSLPQGQFTLALVQDGWKPGVGGHEPAILLLLDARDKSGQLKTDLSDLKKKWIDSGKTVKTEKIRDIEFSEIGISSADLPKGWKKPKTDDEDSTDPAVAAEKKSDVKKDVFIGQADSVLIISTSAKVVENTLARMAGAATKSLGDVGSFDTCNRDLFRDSSLYGWVNAKAFIEMAIRQGEDSADASNSGMPKPGKIISAIGVDGLQSLAFSYGYSGEGAQAEFFLGVPESSRRGVFKILAGEAKESSPPPFVPADAVKFQRWRIDLPKTWAALKQMAADLSPQASGTLDFMLSTAEAGAKEKDPNFDIQKNLFGNLGNDIVTYQKSPKGQSLAELNSPPSIYLIGSPNPEQLVNALKSLITLAGQSGTSTDREFLGHKIYSMALSGMGAAKQPSRSINYTFASGYLAISTDAAMLEEYLRNSQNQAKALRDTSGLNEAAQKVTWNGTSLFGFSNDGESVKALLNALKMTLTLIKASTP